jgi:hypothetical protein
LAALEGAMASIPSVMAASRSINPNQEILDPEHYL